MPLLFLIVITFHVNTNTFGVVIMDEPDNECYNINFKEGDSMICVAVCDDEKCVSAKIEKLAKEFFRKKNIDISVVQYSSGEELLESGREMDILFLDIGMQGIDGIETARRLREHGYKGFLVFITILKEMVFQSFEVQPFDYLVKPVEKENFDKTMERLFLSMQDKKKGHLLVQRGYESNIISFQDIVCCEIIDRKVYVYLTSGEVMDYYEKIENLEKKLDGRFFRCHRSYLINLNYLKSYRNNIAYMTDGKEIPVSRLRNKEFSNVILQYMKEWGV